MCNNSVQACRSTIPRLDEGCVIFLLSDTTYLDIAAFQSLPGACNCAADHIPVGGGWCVMVASITSVGDNRRTLHPPCIHRGCPDKETRLRLWLRRPPSRRCSLTYLLCTDAPCPEGSIPNGVSLCQPTGAVIHDPRRTCAESLFSLY